MTDTRWSFSVFAGVQVHMGVCGSVAAYKAVELMRLFQKSGMDVSVTLTDSTRKFISPLTFESLGAVTYGDMFSSKGEDPFDHLAPGAAADVFVLAPATATTLARLRAGDASEMLSAQCLAFKGPLVLAPAMNPRMWEHPATQENVRILQERGANLVVPESGPVACGDVGSGKLADIQDIFLHTLRAVAPQDMAGKKVMLTLGPTREPWDGVRFWSNPSTGLMGSCLAVAAWLRGAEVHAVAGPGVAPLPAGITTHAVGTAAEMFAKADELWDAMDIGIFTAAVADFSPVPHGKEKFKKAGNEQGVTLKLTPNKDILATLAGRKRPGQKILGFAAETSDLEEQVSSKLTRKNADLMAGNYVGRAGSGFASSTNTAYVLDKNGANENFANISKADLAWRLLSWLLTL